MNFAEAAIKNAAFTRTENGAVALNTSSERPVHSAARIRSGLPVFFPRPLR